MKITEPQSDHVCDACEKKFIEHYGPNARCDTYSNSNHSIFNGKPQMVVDQLTPVQIFRLYRILNIIDLIKEDGSSNDALDWINAAEIAIKATINCLKDA